VNISLVGELSQDYCLYAKKTIDIDFICVILCIPFEFKTLFHKESFKAIEVTLLLQ
jgi:hypothetical protein